VSGAFDQAAADAFVQGLWQGVVYDGKPCGVPHQIDTTAFLYRKDAFEAAKITDVPTTLDEAWTWEEFGAAADKLAGVVKGKQSPFIYDWQSAGAYRWLSWLFQAGGNLLADDLKSPAIDSPEARRAVEFTQSFFTNKWVARNTSVKSTTYPDTAFISGTVAMAFAGDFLIPFINTNVGKKFEYASMPMPRDKAAASDLGGNAIVDAKDGKHTDAATKFLQFLVSEQQMRNYCEATGQLPTLTSLTTSKLDFKIRPDLMDVFVAQATTLTPEQVRQVTVPQFAKINAGLQDELEKAFLGGRSAADTTAALAAMVQQAGRDRHHSARYCPAGSTASALGCRRHPVHRTGPGAGGRLLDPSAAAGVRARLRQDRPAQRSRHVHRACQLRTDAHRPDLLSRAAQHLAVHRADCPREHGDRPRVRRPAQLRTARPQALPDHHLLPLVISGVAVGLIGTFLFNETIGVVDKMLAALGLPTVAWQSNGAAAFVSVVLITLWIRVGFTMIIYLAGLQGVPVELHEAAQVEGANAGRRFRWITLPLL
jgi:multiple sugar transport system substrate-binding protein